MRTVLLAVIRLYRAAISPMLGVACRYEPTCSAYAYEAIERHGAWRGLRLAAVRLSHCRPGGGSGYDPVPDGDTLGEEPPTVTDPAPRSPARDAKVAR
jgi:hypothetical protein